MMIIACDFDGTLCENEYPNIGKPIKATIDYIKNKKAKGARIILWTCREGEFLIQAVNWCKLHNIEFDAVNKNIDEMINLFGSDSRKIYADEYIDDKAVNVNSIINKNNKVKLIGF